MASRELEVVYGHVLKVVRWLCLLEEQTPFILATAEQQGLLTVKRHAQHISKV